VRRVKQLFPTWTNLIPTVGAIGALGGLVAVAAGVTYWFTPNFWEVGYMPEQPIEFSHQLHAGELGIDCRYCHTNVEESAHSNVPSSSTCMSCHTVADQFSGYLAKATSVDGSTPSAHWQSADLQALRSYHGEDLPVPWRRIHVVPDYAHFNHAVHVNAGVSCYSCHGRIDQMPVVYQAESLSMGWCLECHREPEKYLIDTSQTAVTKLWEVEELLSQEDYAVTIGANLRQRLRDQPPQHCGACHY
jgi:hypothetical protein